MTTRALVLYAKPGCHLCDDLRALVEDLLPELGATLHEVDITTDPALHARYRHDIPVLVADGIEIARGRVGEGALVAALRGWRAR
ncbi:MAG: glutaredoxin family protein [Vicinamibacterales bacterium]